MRILKTFGHGFQTTNKKVKIVLYLWIINFVFSIMIVTPIYYLINKDLSRSLMANQLDKGVNILWLGDIIYKYKDFYPALLGWFIIPGILFLLLYIYLNGGIIGRIVAQGERVDLASFFSDCGKHFFRFFRVFLISLVGYVVVFGVIFRIISAPFNIWEKHASTEWSVIFPSNIKFLILVLLFSVVRMFFDYVRVRLVVEDSKKTIRATLLNMVFIGKRFFKAWFLYLLVGLITVAFGVACLAIYQPLPKMGFLLIVAFIWQQIYMLSRMWTKVLFYSTEYHLFYFYEGKI